MDGAQLACGQWRRPLSLSSAAPKGQRSGTSVREQHVAKKANSYLYPIFLDGQNPRILVLNPGGAEKAP
jgi:hypothetical protein